MDASDALASFLSGMRGPMEPSLLFHLRCIQNVTLAGSGAMVIASGNPSSSSSRKTFMYVKVPIPMPWNWLAKYSILTYFVPSVAYSLFRRR